MKAVVPCLVDPSLGRTPKGYCNWRWVNPATRKVYWHAHAAILAQQQGRDIRPGHMACHKCNNKACLRYHPDHLYEGTQSDNERDKHRAPPHAVYPVAWITLPRSRRSARCGRRRNDGGQI